MNVPSRVTSSEPVKLSLKGLLGVAQNKLHCSSVKHQIAGCKRQKNLVESLASFFFLPFVFNLKLMQVFNSFLDGRGDSKAL